MKLWWRFDLGPAQTPLTIGANRDKGMDPGMFFSLSQHSKVIFNMQM